MDVNSTHVKVKDTMANPGPLGLLAFGMTTILLNIQNAAFFDLGTMIMAMGIIYAGSAIYIGIAQIINDHHGNKILPL